MKARFFLTMLVGLMLFLFLSGFSPFPQTDPGGGLSPELVIVLTAVIIPMLIQVLKFIAASFHVVWQENTVMIICFVISGIIAAIWIKPIFPALPAFSADPPVFIQAIFDFLANLLMIASSVFGLATVIYRLVLKAVFKALGIGNDQVKFLAG